MVTAALGLALAGCLTYDQMLDQPVEQRRLANTLAERMTMCVLAGAPGARYPAGRGRGAPGVRDAGDDLRQ
jgi:hypothetical protein